jgi:colanic acid biosynthesis glycosyl transferase WcaI
VTQRGMRVTVVGINYAPEPTGIAPYTAKMAGGLRDRGHQVQVVSTFPHYPDWRVPAEYAGWTRHEVVDGLEVTRVRHYVPTRPQGVRRLASEVTFGLRASAVRWGSPEVVLMPSPALIGSAVALRRVRGRTAPAVGMIVQDLYSAGLAETAGGAVARAITRLEAATLRSADEVAVIHDRFKKRVVNDLGVDADKVSVIRNWTHVPPAPVFDRAAFRAAQGWGVDEHVVLHTGAMGEKQGLGNVVAAARVADQRGAPVRFVLVGDGGQRQELERLASGVRRLEFGAPVSSEDYPKLLASADVLLVNERPGHVETAVPSKLTSYFSSGRPVLAATEAASTTADEVADSGAGRRVDPDDPGHLLDAVLDLAADPAAAAALGSAGPDYCARVCSEAASLDAYDAMVRRLAAIGSTRRNNA